MNWIAIDGKNEPSTSPPQEGSAASEWRGLLWVDDEFNRGPHMGCFYKFRDGHQVWKIDGSNSTFKVTHFCEITEPTKGTKCHEQSNWATT